MPRMRILSPSEQEAFDKPPLFDHRERKKFFEFPKILLETTQSMRDPDHRVGFLLCCGYFKATRRFYALADFEPRDIAYVANQLGNRDTTINSYPDRTRQRHQQRILKFYGFSPFDVRTETALGAEITTMARMHLKPRLIFDRCVDFLIQRRALVPKAGTLFELIRAGLHERKAELVAQMDAHLTDEARGLLDDLFTTPDEQNRYRLTLLKKLSQSTKPTRIKESIADFDTLEVLYRQLEDIMSVLDLGTVGIRYFAGSVLKSRMFQLQQRSEADRYIHAAAFVAHQFFRAQDNLIDLWLSVMASFQTTAYREHKERLLQNRKDQQKQIKIIIDGLDVSVFGVIHEIRCVANAANLSDTQKVLAIQALLDRKHTKDFDRLKADLEETTHDRDWYDILEARSLRLQNRLSPILKVLNFEPHGRAGHLMAAITHFREKEGKIPEHAPMEFLSAEERDVLNRDDGTFRPSLYKVFLFQHVTDAIKSGDLNLAPSCERPPAESRWLQVTAKSRIGPPFGGLRSRQLSSGSEYHS